MPLSSPAMVSSRRDAPAAAILSCSVSKLSSGAISTSVFRSISPVSMPFAINMVVIPVTVSPSIIARCMGAAPRYFGRSEPCTLIQPYSGIFKISSGSICPKAVTAISSALYFRSSSTNSGAFTRSGCKTARPCASAYSFTGENASFLPLPFGLSGCVITASTSCSRRRASSEATAKSGVPIKITLMPALLTAS